MRKYLIVLVAALMCACCLVLAACGGSSSSTSAASSAASGSAASTSAASSEGSVSASAASTSAASTSASASSASSEVSAELKEFADRYVPACEDMVAIADKAEQEGYEAVKDDWEKAQSYWQTMTEENTEWARKAGAGELSAADKSYYMKVVYPAMTSVGDAASKMLKLMTS